MNYHPGHERRGAAPDPASLWVTLLASPAAPRAMSALELDGYLTGVIVAPCPIRPGRWLAGLWDEDGPLSPDEPQMHSALGAISAMYAALGANIDRSLRRLQTEKVCDYRPAFQPTEGKPAHDAIRAWASGFWKAMALVPAEWSALIADERLQAVMTPLVGFIDVGDPEFEPAEDIDERLDAAAAHLPRAILILRRIAQLRAMQRSTSPATRRGKICRNDPCPCGSGQKYKRCCGPS
jgi:uncharacterized protein